MGFDAIVKPTQFEHSFHGLGFDPGSFQKYFSGLDGVFSGSGKGFQMPSIRLPHFADLTKSGHGFEDALGFGNTDFSKFGTMAGLENLPKLDGSFAGITGNESFLGMMGGGMMNSLAMIALSIGGIMVASKALSALGKGTVGAAKLAFGSGKATLNPLRNMASAFPAAAGRASVFSKLGSAFSRALGSTAAKGALKAAPFVGAAFEVGEGIYDVTNGNKVQGAWRLGGAAVGGTLGGLIAGLCSFGIGIPAGAAIGAGIGGFVGGLIGKLFG